MKAFAGRSDFDDFADDFPDGIDDDDDEYYDCAMMPDGQCGKAGSEECDWECPIMADIIRAEIARKEKKKP